MAIDWIYDDGHVGLGVEWATETTAGKFAFSADVYRWDSQNTADSATCSEWLRYEPDGTEGEWDFGFGSGSGYRVVDWFGRREYDRKAADYGITIALRTSSNFGTWYGGYFHTVGVVEASSTVTVPHLAQAVTGLTVSRASDNLVNLSWALPPSAVDGVEVEVRIDGGAWANEATLGGSATSYAYSKAAADHVYEFRVRTSYIGSKSAYKASQAVSMSPAAPAGVTLERDASGNVLATVDNGSRTATKLQWQASTDGKRTWGAVNDSASLTSFTATGLTGTAYIRVRNANEFGSSAWVESEAVQLMAAPNAPTILSPTDGSIITTESGRSIAFSWRHNPVDGSAQTRAEYKITAADGSEYDHGAFIGSASSAETDMPKAGTTLALSVRTKGAAAEWSEWSSAVEFSVFSPPVLSVTTPDGVITGMPMEVSAKYSDMAGYSCVGATVSIVRAGRVLYSEPAVRRAGIGGVTIISATISVGEFVPEDGARYSVRVDARSSSGLSASAEHDFTPQWEPPVAGSLAVENDPETGYARLTASYSNSGRPSGIAAASAVSVARRNLDGSMTVLIDHGKSGSGCVDRYAPLNRPYAYLVTTHANTGATRTVEVPAVLHSDHAFAYWSKGGVEKMARGTWDPTEGGIGVSRPQKKRHWFLGRRDPVSYDGKAVERTESPGFSFFAVEDAEAFCELMEDGGRGVYKSLTGSVFRADFDALSMRPDMDANGFYGPITVKVTRIAGDAL